MSPLPVKLNLPMQSLRKYLRVYASNSEKSADDWASEETATVKIGDVYTIFHPARLFSETDDLSELTVSGLALVFREDAGFPMNYFIDDENFEMSFMEGVLSTKASEAREQGLCFYCFHSTLAKPMSAESGIAAGGMHKWGGSGERTKAPHGLPDPLYFFMTSLGVATDPTLAREALPINEMVLSLWNPQELKPSSKSPNVTDFFIPLEGTGSAGSAAVASVAAAEPVAEASEPAVDYGNLSFSALLDDLSTVPVAAPDPATAGSGNGGTSATPVEPPVPPAQTEQGSLSALLEKVASAQPDAAAPPAAAQPASTGFQPASAAANVQASASQNPFLNTVAENPFTSLAAPGSADSQTASPQAASPQAASPQAASPQAASPQAASPQAASPQAATPPAAATPVAAPVPATVAAMALDDDENLDLAKLENALKDLVATQPTATTATAGEAAAPPAAKPAGPLGRKTGLGPQFEDSEGAWEMLKAKPKTSEMPAPTAEPAGISPPAAEAGLDFSAALAAELNSEVKLGIQNPDAAEAASSKGMEPWPANFAAAMQAELADQAQPPVAKPQPKGMEPWPSDFAAALKAELSAPDVVAAPSAEPVTPPAEPAVSAPSAVPEGKGMEPWPSDFAAALAAELSSEINLGESLLKESAPEPTAKVASEPAPAAGSTGITAALAADGHGKSFAGGIDSLLTASAPIAKITDELPMSADTDIAKPLSKPVDAKSSLLKKDEKTSAKPGSKLEQVMAKQALSQTSSKLLNNNSAVPLRGKSDTSKNPLSGSKSPTVPLGGKKSAELQPASEPAAEIKEQADSGLAEPVGQVEQSSAEPAAEPIAAAETIAVTSGAETGAAEADAVNSAVMVEPIVAELTAVVEPAAAAAVNPVAAAVGPAAAAVDPAIIAADPVDAAEDPAATAEDLPAVVVDLAATAEDLPAVVVNPAVEPAAAALEPAAAALEPAAAALESAATALDPAAAALEPAAAALDPAAAELDPAAAALDSAAAALDPAAAAVEPSTASADPTVEPVAVTESATAETVILESAIADLVVDEVLEAAIVPAPEQMEFAAEAVPSEEASQASITDLLKTDQSGKGNDDSSSKTGLVSGKIKKDEEKAPNIAATAAASAAAAAAASAASAASKTSGSTSSAPLGAKLTKEPSEASVATPAEAPQEEEEEDESKPQKKLSLQATLAKLEDQSQRAHLRLTDFKSVHETSCAEDGKRVREMAEAFEKAINGTLQLSRQSINNKFQALFEEAGQRLKGLVVDGQRQIEESLPQAIDDLDQIAMEANAAVVAEELDEAFIGFHNLYKDRFSAMEADHQNSLSNVLNEELNKLHSWRDGELKVFMDAFEQILSRVEQHRIASLSALESCVHSLSEELKRLQGIDLGRLELLNSELSENLEQSCRLAEMRLTRTCDIALAEKILPLLAEWKSNLGISARNLRLEIEEQLESHSETSLSDFEPVLALGKEAVTLIVSNVGELKVTIEEKEKVELEERLSTLSKYFDEKLQALSEHITEQRKKERDGASSNEANTVQKVDKLGENNLAKIAETCVNIQAELFKQSDSAVDNFEKKAEDVCAAALAEMSTDVEAARNHRRESLRRLQDRLNKLSSVVQAVQAQLIQ